jgi:hypothetical protein
MIVYLETRSGSLADHAVDLITSYRLGTDRAYEVDYHVGSEARTTYATAQDVKAYMEAQGYVDF